MDRAKSRAGFLVMTMLASSEFRAGFDDNEHGTKELFAYPETWYKI